MKGNRSITAILLVVALLLPAAAQAVRSDPDDRRRVVELITHPTHVPTLADWQRIGPSANRVLVEVFQERDQTPKIRALVLHYLAWFPSRRTRAFLTGLMNDRFAESSERRAAMVTLGRTFGESALVDLAPFLRVREKPLREGAIRGIGAVRHSKAWSLLDRHRTSEPDVDLRLLTEKLLERLPRS